MRKTIIVLVILAGISTASSFWFSGDATFQSKYIWRGIVYNDGAVLQPWVAAGIEGAALTVWGNADLTDKNMWVKDEIEQDPTGKFTEIDLILNYTKQLGPVSLTAGYNKYWYPNSLFEEVNASELTLSAGYSSILNPTVTMAYSLEDAEGLYTALGLSHSIVLSERVSAGISTNLGFGDEAHNGYYYGVEEAGLGDLTVGIALPIVINANFTVTPMMDYATLLKSEISDLFENPSNARGGLSINYYYE